MDLFIRSLKNGSVTEFHMRKQLHQKKYFRKQTSARMKFQASWNISLNEFPVNFQ